MGGNSRLAHCDLAPKKLAFLGGPRATPGSMRCHAAAFALMLFGQAMLLLAPGTAGAREATPGRPATPVAAAKDLPDSPFSRRLLGLKKKAKKLGVSAAAQSLATREALRARQRATEAKAAGDGKHAAQLTQLAVLWVEVLESVIRAVETELRAQAKVKAAKAASLRAKRARSLLAMTQKRRMRLRAKLKSVRMQHRQHKQDSQAAERKRIDKAAAKSNARQAKAKAATPARKRTGKKGSK